MIPFDASGAFRPVAQGGELRRLAVRGAAATISGQGLGFAAQFVSTVMLARLVTPADFGVITMVTTFSLLLVSVGISGFIEPIIQAEEIDHQTASNLFWLNVGIALVLAVAFAASGELLARLYRNPLVARVTVAMAVSVLIPGASVVPLALLKRAMRFAAVSTSDLAGRVVNCVVAILLAWKGWGYWALVAGIVAQQLSLTLGALWLCRWMPSFPRRTGRTLPLIRFAGSVYGRFGVRYATQNIDNVLVGWRFSAASLGFYKKAYDLFALSASQLTAPLHHVALAALSRLNQDPGRFRRSLLNSLGILAFVGMAVGADLTLVGRAAVRLVLGPQWGEAGTIFMFFGPGIGAMLVYNTLGWIHLAIGRPDRWLRWSILEFVVTGMLFIIALPWGPEGVAIAWSLSFWALLIPAFSYAGRPIEFGASCLIAAVWKYAAASLVAGLATAAIVRGTPFWGTPSGAGAALEGIVIVSLLFVTLYLAAVILLHWGYAPLRQFSGLLRELVPSRPAAEPAGACK